MRDHTDYVADRAILNADREWREMASTALKIRKNRCTAEYAEREEQKFTGIFRRLMTDPIEEVEKSSRK